MALHLTPPRPNRPHPRQNRPLLAAALLTLTVGLVSAGLAPAADAQSRSAAAAEPGSYVALGDSYASGEGLGPYEAGTETGTNRCHRSVALSYPELLEAGADPEFDGLESVACSGAQTTSLFAPVRAGGGEPAQLDALTTSTETVTVSVGGNDAGFSEVLSSCIYPKVDSPETRALIPGRPGCRTRLNLLVSGRIAYLARSTERPTYGQHRSLPGVIAAIHRRAPQATIYLTSYPQLVGTTSTGTSDCQVGALGPVPLLITAADARWMASKSAQLEAVVETSAVKARLRGIDVRFVGIGEAFRGHAVCDSDTPWINPLILGPTGVSTASFHPTAPGQQAYADAVQRVASP